MPSLLERLSDDELKKENKATENKLDTVSCLIWACKCLASRATNNGNLNRGLKFCYILCIFVSSLKIFFTFPQIWKCLD